MSTFLFISGESQHGLYNTNRKHKNYNHVAQCSKCTAISLTVFIFSVIFLSSLSLAFIRPFDFSQECPRFETFGLSERVQMVWSHAG